MTIKFSKTRYLVTFMPNKAGIDRGNRTFRRAEADMIRQALKAASLPFDSYFEKSDTGHAKAQLQLKKLQAAVRAAGITRLDYHRLYLTESMSMSL